MKKITLLYGIFLLTAFAWSTSATGADVPRLTKEELMARLDSPEVIVIDVRTAASWSESNSKIKGAIREDPTKVNTWMNKYPKDKTLVLYCS